MQIHWRAYSGGLSAAILLAFLSLTAGCSPERATDPTPESALEAFAVLAADEAVTATFIGPQTEEVLRQAVTAVLRQPD